MAYEKNPTSRKLRIQPGRGRQWEHHCNDHYRMISASAERSRGTDSNVPLQLALLDEKMTHGRSIHRGFEGGRPLVSCRNFHLMSI